MLGIITLPLLAKMDHDMVKNYLTACEYLQTDPSVAYDIASIERRTEHVLSQWDENDDPKDVEEIRTVLNRHIKMMNAGSYEGDSPVFGEYIRFNRPGKGPHSFQVGGFWGHSDPPASYTATVPEMLAARSAKLIEQGKLKILPGTVSETYMKRELRHDNYDNYMGEAPRWNTRHGMKYE
jgi:hypothetical protein